MIKIIHESILNEDTVKKSNGKWTNRGKDGKEHGEFNSKKEADAQRKAMFSNGYKESIEVDEDVTVTAAEDNGNYMTVVINGKRYEYTPKEDSEFGVGELVSKFNSIRKHSHGKALAWLKKQATGKFTEARRNVDVNLLKSELKAALRKIMTSTEFGFDPSEVDDYSAVDIYYDNDEIIVEVRAEVDYNGLMDIANELNHIIVEYDKDAYFDAVDPGIIRAYIF